MQGESPQARTIGQAPPGWYPDPLHRHEHRYWDGAQWTHHVASHGRQEIDPPAGGSQVLTGSTPVQQGSHSRPDYHAGGSPGTAVNHASKKVQKQVRRLGIADGPEAGNQALLTEPVLVVNQKGKIFEVNAEYAVYDQHGRQIGAVREVGQSLMKKAMSPENRTRRLQVVDMEGRVLIALVQPTRFINSKMIVMGANGTRIGQVVQTFTFNYVRFRLESDGRPLGAIKGENRKESDFSIQDATGSEIGRITRTRAGLAKELLTKADNYVVEIYRPLDEPLRSLVISAALAIDTALRQK